MIRLYLLLGVLAAFVALGGYALLERSWRQIEQQRAASLAADLAAATDALEAEKANTRRSAAMAEQQAQKAREATAKARTLEDRASALIIELSAEPPPAPACSCGFDSGWRERLRREIPIGSTPIIIDTPAR